MKYSNRLSWRCERDINIINNTPCYELSYSFMTLRYMLLSDFIPRINMSWEGKRFICCSGQNIKINMTNKVICLRQVADNIGRIDSICPKIMVWKMQILSTKVKNVNGLEVAIYNDIRVKSSILLSYLWIKEPIFRVL